MATHEEDPLPPFELEWKPAREAMTCRRWEASGGPTLLLLSHVASPYFEIREQADAASLNGMAFNYLRAASMLDIDPPFKLEEGWLDSLDPESRNEDLHFGWMDFDDDSRASVNIPMGSVNASRAFDSFAVLFAAERYGSGMFIGSEFGLRVAIHWIPYRGKKLFHIVGATATLPWGPYKESRLRIDARDVDRIRAYLFGDAARDRIASASGFEPQSIRLRGARIARLDGGIVQVERQAIGLRREAAGLHVPHVISTIGSGELYGPSGEHRVVQTMPMVADAGAGCARIFKYTPPPTCGCRPRRDAEDLDSARNDGRIVGGTAPQAVLQDGNRLQVLPSTRFVRADRGKVPPLSVPTPGGAEPEPRSDAASAIQAFWHSRDLLRRLSAYGLDASTYFRFIHPRMEVAYRSGVSPGPGKDGQSVNARVLPTNWPPDFIGPVSTGQLPIAQIHLSLADRARRERKHWVQDTPPNPAEPLGIGSDPRWMWHEFGHVLTLATTGELELRFAHSPGDALAAIVGDPDLDHRSAAGAWRWATFPWVYLPRRHDRCVSNGWSWSGTMHRDLDRVPSALHPRRKGYQSEQILSSSLFRLYRCIGGDTIDPANQNAPSRMARLGASHFACFLIMRTLQTLGDAKVSPAMKPDQFVEAMIQADMFTGTWSISYPPAPEPSLPFSRVGGCTGKVIRWAFEAQGLYGNGNAPGSPPPVDIFVRSLRPRQDAALKDGLDYSAGSYVPVSLHWQADASRAAPAWQADPAEGILWDANSKTVHVRVRNRGSVAATNVEVSVWATAWTGGNPPAWDPNNGAWGACQPYNSGPKNIAPGQFEAFGPFGFDKPAGGYLIVAAAHCPADPACIRDPAHACSFLPTPLVDLIAGDNNMGLLAVVVV